MHCNACIKYDNCDEFLIYRNRKHESIFYIPHSRRSDKRAYSPKPKENRFLTAKQISFNDFFSPSLSHLSLHRYFNLFDVHFFLLFLNINRIFMKFRFFHPSSKYKFLSAACTGSFSEIAISYF